MKFRRKAAESTDEPTEAPGEDSGDGAAPTETPTSAGPFDAEDLVDTEGRVDLGALVLLPVPGTELQLQVDETSGNVQSVMFAGPEGALELRVFAAPRHGDLWSEVRPQIAADLGRRGGTATEREGPWGTELICQVGQRGGNTQVTRVIGINGPRWMLRASLMGQPAVKPDEAAAWEESIRKIAVHRGAQAMPVGESLPVVMPPQARRVDQPSQ